MPLSSKCALVRSGEESPQKGWPCTFARVFLLGQTLKTFLTQSVITGTIFRVCTDVLEHALLLDPARVDSVELKSVRFLGILKLSSLAVLASVKAYFNMK